MSRDYQFSSPSFSSPFSTFSSTNTRDDFLKKKDSSYFAPPRLDLSPSFSSILNSPFSGFSTGSKPSLQKSSLNSTSTSSTFDDSLRSKHAELSLTLPSISSPLKEKFFSSGASYKLVDSQKLNDKPTFHSKEYMNYLAQREEDEERKKKQQVVDQGKNAMVKTSIDINPNLIYTKPKLYSRGTEIPPVMDNMFGKRIHGDTKEAELMKEAIKQGFKSPSVDVVYDRTSQEVFLVRQTLNERVVQTQTPDFEIDASTQTDPVEPESYIPNVEADDMYPRRIIKIRDKGTLTVAEETLTSTDEEDDEIIVEVISKKDSTKNDEDWINQRYEYVPNLPMRIASESLEQPKTKKNRKKSSDLQQTTSKEQPITKDALVNEPSKKKKNNKNKKDPKKPKKNVDQSQKQTRKSSSQDMSKYIADTYFNKQEDSRTQENRKERYEHYNGIEIVYEDSIGEEKTVCKIEEIEDETEPIPLHSNSSARPRLEINADTPIEKQTSKVSSGTQSSPVVETQSTMNIINDSSDSITDEGIVSSDSSETDDFEEENETQNQIEIVKDNPVMTAEPVIEQSKKTNFEKLKEKTLKIVEAKSHSSSHPEKSTFSEPVKEIDNREDVSQELIVKNAENQALQHLDLDSLAELLSDISEDEKLIIHKDVNNDDISFDDSNPKRESRQDQEPIKSPPISQEIHSPRNTNGYESDKNVAGQTEKEFGDEMNVLKENSTFEKKSEKELTSNGPSSEDQNLNIANQEDNYSNSRNQENENIKEQSKDEGVYSPEPELENLSIENIIEEIENKRLEVSADNSSKENPSHNDEIEPKIEINTFLPPSNGKENGKEGSDDECSLEIMTNSSDEELSSNNPNDKSNKEPYPTTEYKATGPKEMDSPHREEKFNHSQKEIIMEGINSQEERAELSVSLPEYVTLSIAKEGDSEASKVLCSSSNSSNGDDSDASEQSYGEEHDEVAENISHTAFSERPKDIVQIFADRSDNIDTSDILDTPITEDSEEETPFEKMLNSRLEMPVYESPKLTREEFARSDSPIAARLKSLNQENKKKHKLGFKQNKDTLKAFESPKKWSLLIKEDEEENSRKLSPPPEYSNLKITYPKAPNSDSTEEIPETQSDRQSPKSQEKHVGLSISTTSPKLDNQKTEISTHLLDEKEDNQIDEIAEQKEEESFSPIRGDINFSKGQYSGELDKKGQPNGKGFYKGSDLTYDGSWLNGKKSGYGRIEYPDGSVYTGELLEDTRHGQGYYFTPNYTHVGAWEKDKKNGQGVIEYPSLGDKFEGNFVNNFPEGKGIFTFSDGSVYCGEFEKGCRHGEGTLTYGDGVTKYEGEWTRDKQTGKAIITYLEGVYEGEVVEGKRQGHGTFTYANNDIYDGEWVNDQKQGKGIYFFEGLSSGVLYRGEWFKGKKNGVGILETKTKDNLEKKLTTPNTKTLSMSFDEVWSEGRLVSSKKVL